MTREKDQQQRPNLATTKILLLSTLLTASTLLSYRLYRHLQPIKSSHAIPHSYFNRKNSLYGKVISVGDGDNFHLYHTPYGVLGGWGWLRDAPLTNTRGLKGKTIPVRLYGVDAPERSHFGKPAQPYSEEALIWLRQRILGRGVSVTPFRIDQYGRVVGKVIVYDWLGLAKRDVSLEMVKYGIGVVYEGKSSGEFGGQLGTFQNLETQAKYHKRGLWGVKQKKGTKFVSPGEYKKSYHEFTKQKKN